jgi:hypothetical protein
LPIKKLRKVFPSWHKAYERLFGQNPLLCPACKTGILVRRAVLPPLGK